MKKVNIGIVGSKFAADFHADCYTRFPDKAEIKAFAAKDNLEAFSKKWDIPDYYEDYNELLARDDIDVISICVPNFLHHEITIAAANAGKHVICEKPLGITADECREMVDACARAGVKLFYAEDWCFAPALQRTVELIEEGAVGEVLYIKAKEVHNGTHSPFAKNAKTCGGGSLIHLGIHPVGWAIYLLGNQGANPVVEVTGFTNSGGDDNFVHKDNSGEDWACGIMKFKDGKRAFMEGNYITVGGMDDKIEIYGTEGVIKTDLTFSSPVSVYSRPGYEYTIEKADNTLGWTRPAVDEFYNLGYVKELDYFIHCIATNEKPRWGVNAAVGLKCIEVITAMYESSASGKTINGEW